MMRVSVHLTLPFEERQQRTFFQCNYEDGAKATSWTPLFFPMCLCSSTSCLIRHLNGQMRLLQDHEPVIHRPPRRWSPTLNEQFTMNRQALLLFLKPAVIIFRCVSCQQGNTLRVVQPMTRSSFFATTMSSLSKITHTTTYFSKWPTNQITALKYDFTLEESHQIQSRQQMLRNRSFALLICDKAGSCLQQNKRLWRSVIEHFNLSGDERKKGKEEKVWNHLKRMLYWGDSFFYSKEWT